MHLSRRLLGPVLALGLVLMIPGPSSAQRFRNRMPGKPAPAPPGRPLPQFAFPSVNYSYTRPYYNPYYGSPYLNPYYGGYPYGNPYPYGPYYNPYYGVPFGGPGFFGPVAPNPFGFGAERASR